MLTPKNTRGRPVTKLCLALEAFRRTDEGRARDAKTFLGHFFPQDKDGSRDRLFVHMPHEVRADLLSNWGIRGKKSALRDDDEKVRVTVTDALLAGDIDATVVEEGVTPEILVDWIPLEDWWTFWRGASLPLGCIRKALALARDLALFDDRWFIDHLKLTSQRLEGTDVICAALTKEQIVAWLSVVHTSGDASPAGLVRALGWETILAKTAQDALLHALDALARETGLGENRIGEAKPNAPQPAAISPLAISTGGVPHSKPQPGAEAAKVEPAKAENAKPPSRPPPLPRSTADAALAAKRVDASKPAQQANSSAAKATPTTPHSALVTSTTQATQAARSPDPTKSALTPRTSTESATGYGSHDAAPPALDKPPSAPPSARKSTPAEHLPSVIIELDAPAPAAPSILAQTAPPPPAPISAPPTARALFGAPMHEPPSMHDLPPMRAPQATLSGVGTPPPLLTGTVDVSMPSVQLTTEDPAWAPPRAEPGDMGWDIVYGVKRSMSTHVQPKYNFEDDDEPTSEISPPHITGQR